jgi:DNA segregation ATPase FtsK/SpoIIIE, S-DNA-T family
MAKKNGRNGGKNPQEKPARGREKREEREPRLNSETIKSIWAITFAGVAIVLIFAGFGVAGPAGEFIYNALEYLVGWGYAVLPLALLGLAGVFVFEDPRRLIGITLLGGVLAVLSVLALIEIGSAGDGGVLGLIFGSLKSPFGSAAAIALNLAILGISALITLNSPIRLPRWERKLEEDPASEMEGAAEPEEMDREEKEEDPSPAKKTEREPEIVEGNFEPKKKHAAPKFTNYIAPPLDLLKSSVEKPTTGDLRANANIIKRTLESFGIIVEMGEINIGPKVTRYTLKPAEGVKLSRIESLSKDLSLALAAHPIRIEAPIPGKSLVGIEVPNKSAAIVRLGSLMAYPEFHSMGPLAFSLGRDVTGEPQFGNIEKMPHLLIAGATGSGKSVTIHTLIVSLLYKNSPSNLKFIMIDPKRVELSAYENIPHLVSPVITESKKSVGVFRWALSEMDRRYELLQKAGSRDLKSYNAKVEKDDVLPFIVIVVDELADIMTTYGREVEGSIVRLAQMARATGIHLILATQRPSVEVITGLIKANITSRVALQVASQIDSRTILDTMGAEKLLGGGDLLFMSAELSKPKRIQGSYISEEEIHKVTDFIREHNKAIVDESEAPEFEASKGVPPGSSGDIFDGFGGDSDSDEMYDEAVRVVSEAQKASASLLQRRLKVGYARAARLLDLMEEKGVIGPGDGAKPRDVFMDKPVD